MTDALDEARWMRRAKEIVLAGLRARQAAQGGPLYFAQKMVSGLLRPSGKGGVAEFVLLVLEREGLVARVNKNVPFASAMWRLTQDEGGE